METADPAFWAKDLILGTMLFDTFHMVYVSSIKEVIDACIMIGLIVKRPTESNLINSWKRQFIYLVCKYTAFFPAGAPYTIYRIFDPGIN